MSVLYNDVQEGQFDAHQMNRRIRGLYKKWDFEIIAYKVYLVLKLFLLCSPVED